MGAKSEDMPRERDERGRIKETYPLEEFVAAINELDTAGTRDVAEEVGCSYELAYKKLRTLEDEGRVSSKKFGNTLVWFAQGGETE
jgi:hypothetical protein